MSHTDQRPSWARNRAAAILCLATFFTGCGEQAFVLTNQQTATYEFVHTGPIVDAKFVVYDEAGAILRTESRALDAGPSLAGPNIVSPITGTERHEKDTTYRARIVSGSVLEIYHGDTLLARASGNGNTKTVDYFYHGQIRLRASYTGNWSAIVSAHSVEEPECDPDFDVCDDSDGNFWTCLADAGIVSLGIAVTLAVGYGIVAAIGAASTASAAVPVAWAAYLAAINTPDQTYRYGQWVAAKALASDRALTVVGFIGGGLAWLWSAIVGGYRAWADAANEYWDLHCFPRNLFSSSELDEKTAIADATGSYDPNDWIEN